MPLQKTGVPPDIKDSLYLSAAKFLDTSIRPAVQRILILSCLHPKAGNTLMLAQPAVTQPAITYAGQHGISLLYYHDIVATLKFYVKTLLVAVVFPCLWALRNLFRRGTVPKDQKIDILQFQQDDLRDSAAQRVQPHWFSGLGEEVRQSAGREEPRVLILQHKVGDYQNRQEDLGSFAQKIQTMPMNAIFSLSRWTGGSDESSAMGKVSRRLLVGAFFRSSISARTVSLYLFSMVSLSRHFMHFCRSASARNFVFSDAYSSNVDAMVLACRMLGIRTIGYQYSFLQRPSLTMMSLPDKQLVFFEKARHNFEYRSISPKEFVIAGYPYLRSFRYVSKPAAALRADIQKLGVDFILGYFDEQINRNPERWNLYSIREHRRDLRILAQLVLSNPRIAVILKPQFVYNAVSQLHANDTLIMSAFQTGRLVEIFKGHKVRNVVFPSEVAQSCDLCIGQKLGMTAAFEAALQGTRAVVVNPHKLYGHWDHLFADKRIEFESLATILNTVPLNRDQLARSTIGDWSAVLSELNITQERPFESALLESLVL